MLLSIVLPYYRNPRMLARQYLTWALEWPAWLKELIEVVIVDDGSPEPALEVPRLYNGATPPLSIFRVLEDRPWHQHGARNLGAHVAQAPWLLLTDMDHVIPRDTLGELLRLTHAESGDRFYTFARRDAPVGEPWKSDHWSTMAKTLNRDGELKPHVNSFAMPRDLYWRVGGYDEDLCGIYGTDRHFRDRLAGSAPGCHLPHAPLIRVDREVIPDASTRDVERKAPDRGARKRAVLEKKAAEGRAGQVTTLAFAWERVL